MKTTIDNSTNFGWFYGTHKRITRRALKNIPSLQQFSEKLAEFSKKPDLDEQGIFNNWHFYSPVMRTKYCDFNGAESAYTRYREHVKKMLVAIKANQTDLYIEHAGRALHFLQDMTQPQHTQKGFVFNKLIQLHKHLKFEESARNQDKWFDIYKEIPFRNMTFSTIFKQNVDLSTKNDLPKGEDITKWDGIIEKGINQAIFSTSEFLEKLSKLVNKQN